jgi:hypothetical protein
MQGLDSKMEKCEDSRKLIYSQAQVAENNCQDW